MSGKRVPHSRVSRAQIIDALATGASLCECARILDFAGRSGLRHAMASHGIERIRTGGEVVAIIARGALTIVPANHPPRVLFATAD